MNRRRFIFLTTGGALLAAGLGVGLWRSASPAPGVASTTSTASPSSTTQSSPSGQLDSTSLTKYVDALPVPRIASPQTPGGTSYEIRMTEFETKLHSQLPPTRVWGYDGTFPGPTFEATRGRPVSVAFLNGLPTRHLFSESVDHTIPHVHGLPEVRTVVHLHGAEVKADSDGNPTAWYSFNFNSVGSGWTQREYSYPNSQQAATLWYHDHALGVTRLNVDAGLAGLYIIRDPSLSFEASLPGGANDPPKHDGNGAVIGGPYELPLIIQDRTFNPDGSLFYPTTGVNPDIHPQWASEFFGNAILVNGKVWPYLNVEPRKYRFRFLNASNARFYNLSFPEKPVQAVPITQIGTDGGYLSEPAPLSEVYIAPAERADVVIDFSRLAVGEQLILHNNAPAPHPGGAPPDPNTVAQIMRLNVVGSTGPDRSVIPATLVPTPRLPFQGETVTNTRSLILIEYDTDAGPIVGLLNNSGWSQPIQEQPVLGSTEIWELINLTEDTHPIHLHLVQFQLVNRQEINATQYRQDYLAANPNLGQGGGLGKVLDLNAYFEDAPALVEPYEAGWKDTIKAHPDVVTRIIARFGPRDGSDSAYRFDATAAPHYVWHCHILEHEDNDMMRPYRVLPR